MHITRLQKVQQKKRPVYSIWRKSQEYNSAWGIPSRSIVIGERENGVQEVVTFVEYKECQYKGTKIEENQG